MKKQSFITILLTVLMSMVGAKAFAWEDIAVENADGVTILYNYINDGTELEVTYYNHGSSKFIYEGVVVIPEEVVFMNRTRKVTRIGEKAFWNCKNLISVIIPNTIISIGNFAFADCKGLTSITIPNTVMSIGAGAFSGCNQLTSIIIPDGIKDVYDETFANCYNLASVRISNNVTRIGASAFSNCNMLKSITIPDSTKIIDYKAFYNCENLISVSFGKSLETIKSYAFYGCINLSSITLPNSVTSIESNSFYHCDGMKSLSIGKGVTKIGDNAFERCSSLTSIVLPNSLLSIGQAAFSGVDFSIVISEMVEPCNTYSSSFSNNTVKNATLYVPVGTIDKYKASWNWEDFLFIEEGTGPDGGGETPEIKKCATPTIGYQNGKLMFNCDTEGATCQSTITDTDITSYSSNEVQLGVTYNISVYATKAGYENSDVAKATLCWIDVEPKTEGITNIVSNIRARAILIQSKGNQLTISGAEEGTVINVYDISGRPAGSTKASSEITTINTTLRSGDIGIVKIGDKAVKVLMK